MTDDALVSGRPEATPAQRRTSQVLMRRAAFLDRDGTLIVDRHYLKDPAQVELVPHAPNAVRRFNYALMPVIVITNQSGIARGLLSEADYRQARARLDDLLEERGAFIDDHYHCPHHPDISGPCECRKPGIGMYEQAIVEHQIDAAHSVFIGDKLRDLLPAKVYGGRGILVPSPETSTEDVEGTLAAGFELASSLTEAALMATDASPNPET
ncbi:MAG: HAD family hydrolase [Gemmatimonadota bacterium]|nr:HAD family hydrolase [Gemmatimonadota bacterium]